MLTHTRKLQISAAVMLLLAGCGGSAGSTGTDKPLATSPAASRTQASTTTSPASPVGNTSTQPSSAATPAPVPAKPAAPVAPPTPVAPATPVAPVTPAAPAAPSTPSTPVGVFSANGIQGAVLATMLDQRSVNVRGDAAKNAAYAYPSTLDGTFPNESGRPVVQSVQFSSADYKGQSSRPGPLGTYQPALGSYTYTSFNGTIVQPEQQTNATIDFAFNSIGMDLGVSNTDTTLTLAGELVALDITGEDYKKGPHYMAKPYSVGKTEWVPFGKVLTEWKNGQNSVQLSLSRIKDGQAALCWNFHLPHTNRLYCNKWQIPSGWAAGQPLIYAGYYLVEMRDGQLMHWHTREQIQ